MHRPSVIAFNVCATTWLIPAGMLAYIREDVPSGSACVMLAVTSGFYAYRALSGRVRRTGRS